MRASVGYSGRPAAVHLKLLRIVPFRRAGIEQQLRHAFELRYLCTAVCGAVPSEPYSASTSSCSTSRRVASTHFGAL